MTPHNPQICKLFTTNPQICKIFKTNPLDSRAAAHISVECASWVSSSLTVHDSTSKASKMRMLRMLNDWIRMHERDGFLEICTSALRVQVFSVCNIIVRIIMCSSSRLQKCKLCLRHSCPFTTFYERRKAISIAGEGNGATDAASADVW